MDTASAALMLPIATWAGALAACVLARVFSWNFPPIESLPPRGFKRRTIAILRGVFSWICILSALYCCNILLRSYTAKSWACNAASTPGSANKAIYYGVYMLSLLHDVAGIFRNNVKILSSPTVWSLAALWSDMRVGDLPLVMALLAMRLAAAELEIVSQDVKLFTYMRRFVHILWCTHFYYLVWNKDCAHSYPTPLFYLFLFANIHLSLPVSFSGSLCCSC